MTVVISFSSGFVLEINKWSKIMRLNLSEAEVRMCNSFRVSGTVE